jgi:hypothetical protein
MREPNMEDTQQLLSINEKRGFLGMLGIIDCMHLEWKNCPLHGKGSIHGMLWVVYSYLRPLLAKIMDLVFCILVGSLFGTLLGNRVFNICGRSSILV